MYHKHEPLHILHPPIINDFIHDPIPILYDHKNEQDIIHPIAQSPKDYHDLTNNQAILPNNHLL